MIEKLKESGRRANRSQHALRGRGTFASEIEHRFD